MKKQLVVIFLISSFFLSAQDSSIGVQKHLFKINLLISPNIDYELGISKYSTIGFQLGAEIGGLKSNETNKVYFGLFPSAKMYYRYYHNFKGRASKEKNTHNNSANYFGFTTSYLHKNPIVIENNNFKEYNASYVYMGPVYGFQRTYWKKVSLGLEMGLGYGYSNSSNNGIAPILNFNLGWVLGSK